MTTTTTGLEVREASLQDLEWIYSLRHRVYAEELGQHALSPTEQLRDALDGDNVYLVAASGPTPIGFVSVTPPWAGQFGLDKYFTRDELPVLDSDAVFEVRILTVDRDWRGSGVATLLMYAALRWISSRGGRTIVAMGRTEVLEMYLAVGLVPAGLTVTSGAVDFEVMTASTSALTAMAQGPYREVLHAWEADLTWHLDTAFWPRADGCEHGGASFGAIGTGFSTLQRRDEVVAADVLDAWFSPPPRVLAALTDNPSWAARTSPPTDADGMVAAIASGRGLPADALAVGAGSSDLIFRAFGQWLTAESRVLLMDPGYGEYVHVTERVIGCHVDRFRLRREDDWRIDPAALAAVVRSGDYDLVVVVNPNNPTGRHVPAAELRVVIEGSPMRTRWWIDEAYLGYVDPEQSLAPLAAAHSRVVVCTSLSKMFGLSGMRAAFLVAEPSVAADLRRWTPPWPVSLPAQMAAVAALGEPDYYHDCWQRTHELRAKLSAELSGLDAELDVDEGVANFLNIVLPMRGPSAAAFVAECRRHDVYLRDLSPLSSQYEGRTVRVAVKDARENSRIVNACRAVLDAHRRT
ncbi:aminotransferase class I/II-fold pyridoxal phosphate-dependent enzyme [Aeromicrobium panaciterrae]|uniref:aminotransferase class I/II-fold pyridoxal phosphate-dependent enzyme n=1 Tax=Aeromicrobium panaciterrae TaxID=363861 RepID=UPI0031E3B6AE